MNFLRFTIKIGVVGIAMIMGNNYPISAQNWVHVPGIVAQDIGVGKNGSVWATGPKDIYKWNGSSWQSIGGGASRISVGPDAKVWVVNDAGQIYQFDPSINNWTLRNGSAKDISVGADGSIWIIGTVAAPGGYEILKWNGSGWAKIQGGAVRIAVDPSGKAWVVNNTGNIFRYNGSYFESKPGVAKDIGIGANGTIWCTGTDGQIYQWVDSNWKVQTGGASQVAVAPDGNAWVVNDGGQVYRSTDAATPVTIRTIFPKGQTYEYRMLKALKMKPYVNTIGLGGTVPDYAKIDPLGQAFGRLGLLAAEILYNDQALSVTPQKVLSDIGDSIKIRQAVSGILAALIVDQLNMNAVDPSTNALRSWAANLFRSMKIRLAKATLDEYYRWKSNPCAFEGLTETQCRGKYGVSNLMSPQKPPQDIIGKDALGTVLGTNKDEIAAGVSLGLAAATFSASAIAVASGMSAALEGIATVAVGTAAQATWGCFNVASLWGAFGAQYAAGANFVAFSSYSSFATAGLVETAGANVPLAAHVSASGSIGATSWVGVVAAPVAAAVLCIVVGTMEGFAVVEAAKLEPTLKMKLGAAISEYINIKNVMADSTSRGIFLIAFEEALRYGFQIPDPKVDGEVRFYCQAGYVSSFRLSYTLNGQNQTYTTPDLSVGHERTYGIPYNATNIRVQGWYSLGGWKELFNVALDRPTYICYTSYGTVFEPRYKTDCPEVGSMTTKPNELTVTQGGGYSAWIRLTYSQNNQTVTAIDQNSTAAGWRKVFQIPEGATNIRLQAWSNTGLVWEPWKTIFDKTWPVPPNECVKVYGTSLEPRWNSECN